MSQVWLPGSIHLAALDTRVILPPVLLGIGVYLILSAVWFGREKALQSFEFLDCAEPTRSTNFTQYLVFASLVMGGRTKPARRRTLEFNAFEISVERQVKIEPRLFAIRDHIQAGRQLIVYRCDYGVILKFRAVSRAKLVQVLTRELQPAWKRIATNHRRAEWCCVHRFAR